MDRGIDVERALRLVAVQARRLVQLGHHQVAPLLEDLAHRLDGILRAGQCLHRGGHGDRVGVRRGLALQLVHRLDQRHRRAGEADAPAGHRIGLGASVHRHRAVAQLRLDLHDGGRLEAVIGELLVDVVGEDPHIGVAQQHVADRPQLLRVIGGAGRVARVVQHEPLGARRDRRFQVLGAQLEAVVLAARHQYRRAVGQADDVRVADPARAGDDHLIAGVQRRQEGVEDHLLAAGGDDDLLRLVVQADCRA